MKFVVGVKVMVVPDSETVPFTAPATPIMLRLGLPTSLVSRLLAATTSAVFLLATSESAVPLIGYTFTVTVAVDVSLLTSFMLYVNVALPL